MRYDNGMKVRRAVLGDAWVDKSLAGRTPFNTEFQEFITRTAWGDVWTRPGLDRRMRSVGVLSTTIALGAWEEFRLHIRAAINNGLTQDEIKEVILQSAIYSGVPKANHAMKEAGDVLNEIAAPRHSHTFHSHTAHRAEAMTGFAETLLDHFHGRAPIRAGSLIVTLFGDAIVPRGGELALASLAEIMRAFRISESLVRTAMSRLVSDGLFVRRKTGRNTFYSLSPAAAADFAEAAKKIYGPRDASWDGRLRLLLIDGSAAERAAARNEAQALGFGALTPDLMLGLSSGPEIANAVRLCAEASDDEAACRLATRAWPLNDLAERYLRFNAMFVPVRSILDDGPADELGCLVARILMIHEYRRVVLRDPLLPAPLLRPIGQGREAHDSAADIYRIVADPADRWLTATRERVRSAAYRPRHPTSERFARTAK